MPTTGCSGLLVGDTTMFVDHSRGDGIHMDDNPLPFMDGVLAAPRDQQSENHGKMGMKDFGHMTTWSHFAMVVYDSM